MRNKIKQDEEFNYIINIIILALVFIYLGADVYGKYLSDERKSYTKRGFDKLEQAISPAKPKKVEIKSIKHEKQLVYIPEYNVFVFSK